MMASLDSVSLHALLFVFGFSVGMTWLVRATAKRYGLVSPPREERWHKKPTALLGGIAIFLSFLVGFLLFVPKEPENILLVVCGTMMFLLGLVDDVRSIKPQTKLLVQILVSVGVVYFGLVLPFSDSEIVNFLFTLFWLVGITNAMNLLDNMDGLCVGIAIIASIYRFVFCGVEGHAAGVALALVFTAALAGFLLFNVNPASIFMGDSGSLFVGFLLAGMNVSPNHAYAKSIFSVLLFPVLILLIPIFDTVLVSTIRKLSGRPISVGGKDHSSHRLVAIGLSERKAVLILYGMAAVSGWIAYDLYQRGFSYSLFFISLLVIGMILFGVYLSKVKVYGERVSTIDQKNTFQVAVDFPYKKYVFLVLLDVILISTAYYGAYWLRFEVVSLEDQQFILFRNSFPIVLALSLTSFLVFGVYRYNWRYTGIRDLWIMIKASSAAVISTVIVLTYIHRFEGYSRSVFIIHWGILVMLLAATRLSFRMLTEILVSRPNHNRKVLIYGAGDGGELLLRELKNNSDMETSVLGFLDDDPERIKTRIHGIPVLGSLQTAEFWIRKFEVSQVIISSGKIPSARVAELQEICERAQIDLLRASMKIEKAAV